jgi:hypothetical protein
MIKRNCTSIGWMMILALCGLLLLAGCNKKEEAPLQTDTSASSAPQAGQEGGTAQSPARAPAKESAKKVEPPPPPRQFTLPAGSKITVRTTAPISSKTNKTGDPIEVTLNEPIVEGTWVIATKNALIKGVVVNSDPGGRVKGVASITVSVKSIELADGRSVAIAAEPVMVQAQSSKKKDAVKVGIGAGIGAAIGAIAGGGKGAGIGAGVGGGAGTAAVLATHGDPATIPSESRLTFKLTQPVTITEQVKK